MSKPKTDAKRKGGKRQKSEPPTKPERCKWDPSYCAKVEALGAQGKSGPEIRKELGVSPSPWRAWVKKHADFAEAVEQAADPPIEWDGCHDLRSNISQRSRLASRHAAVFTLTQPECGPDR